MLGRHRQRLAQTQGPGVTELQFGHPTLAFVGDQQDRLLLAAQLRREILVGRGDAAARVHDEQADVGLVQSLHRLPAQPAGEALRCTGLQTRRVDHPELVLPQPADALDPVARDAGRVVDDGLASAHQSVEQGRFADIGAAEDRHRGRSRCRHRNATSWAPSVRKYTVPSATAAGTETAPPSSLVPSTSPVKGDTLTTWPSELASNRRSLARIGPVQRIWARFQVLRIDQGRQRADPADPPALVDHAGDFVALGQDEDEVARDPGGLGRGDIGRPFAYAALEVERRHLAADPGHEDAVAGDHRVAGDVSDAPDRQRSPRAQDRVAPELLAAVERKRHHLAGSVGRDHDPVGDGG